MEFIELKDHGKNAMLIDGCEKIDLAKTFDCGQCFRFEPVSYFGNKVEYGGMVFDKYVVFAQNHENELIIYNYGFCHLGIWQKYFNLEASYEQINADILRAVPSDHMKRAIEVGSGIRLLNQGLFETLISFIISQNNNIPRIKKIIDALCRSYGRVTEFKGKDFYTFPSYKALLRAGADDIAQKTKMGFRAEYVIEACKWYNDLSPFGIDHLSYKEAYDMLIKIKGVGPKVASCILLFGLGKGEAFPIDVHMKRTLEKYFPDGIDISALGANAGLAQQYLFYYEKYNKTLE